MICAARRNEEPGDDAVCRPCRCREEVAELVKAEERKARVPDSARIDEEMSA